jgi:glycosyltransferase involved in cell wall biosynthesis
MRDRKDRRLSLLSIIVPCFNELPVIRETHRSLTATLEGFPEDEIELIYVDDGSTDETLDILRELQESNSQVRVISFSRNFGHQIAVTAGLEEARGDASAMDYELRLRRRIAPKRTRFDPNEISIDASGTAAGVSRTSQFPTNPNPNAGSTGAFCRLRCVVDWISLKSLTQNISAKDRSGPSSSKNPSTALTTLAFWVGPSKLINGNIRGSAGIALWVVVKPPAAKRAVTSAAFP